MATRSPALSLIVLNYSYTVCYLNLQATECMRPGPPLQVGFGSTVPPHMGTEYVARESFHELKAYQEVKAMHERQAAEAQLAANVLPNTHGFPPPPFPDFPPPPPGWYVKKEPEDQPVQPSCQEGASEACSYASTRLCRKLTCWLHSSLSPLALHSHVSKLPW